MKDDLRKLIALYASITVADGTPPDARDALIKVMDDLQKVLDDWTL